MIRGDPSLRRLACYYLSGDQLLAVDAVNSPTDFIFGKKIAGSGMRLDASKLGDPTTDLKRLAMELLGMDKS